MYRILACALPKHELGPERVLAPRELVVQPPRARVPPQDRRALARDPLVVVRGRAASRRAVEEELRVRGERDVHDGGLGRRALQALPEARAERPGGVGREVREDTALLLGCNFVELPGIDEWGEGRVNDALQR